MKLPRLGPLYRGFEIGGGGRLLPMEGLRGVAVGLVFLQHYGTQFSTYGQITGGTLAVARAFAHYGNDGVELFFVLSGYLIYGILLRKRPSFFSFMIRRAQRSSRFSRRVGDRRVYRFHATGAEDHGPIHGHADLSFRQCAVLARALTDRAALPGELELKL